MAATDKTYHNQRTLDIIFAASCILMLVCTIWMLVADYNREFKSVQRNFRDVESVLDERQMISQLPDPDEVKTLQNAIVEKRKAVDGAKEKVQPEEQRLTAERDQRTDAYQSIKADFDSKTSFYNLEISEHNQAGLPQSVRRERQSASRPGNRRLIDFRPNSTTPRKRSIRRPKSTSRKSPIRWRRPRTSCPTPRTLRRS